MPDTNNNLVKEDLLAALQAAELRILQYTPPSIPNVSGIAVNEAPRVNVPVVQREVADKSALERTNALFVFLTAYIAQEASKEIARQQLLQRIANLEQRLALLEASSGTSTV